MVLATIMMASLACASKSELGSLKEPHATVADLEPEDNGDSSDLSEPIYVAPAGRVKLVVSHDAAPWQTSWVLKKGSAVISRQKPNQVTEPNTAVHRIFSLSNGTYTFRISDSNGDGLCCDHGHGYWGLYRR
jgi:hypothetical protein